MARNTGENPPRPKKPEAKRIQLDSAFDTEPTGMIEQRPGMPHDFEHDEDLRPIYDNQAITRQRQPGSEQPLSMPHPEHLWTTNTDGRFPKPDFSRREQKLDMPPEDLSPHQQPQTTAEAPESVVLPFDENETRRRRSVAKKSVAKMRTAKKARAVNGEASAVEEDDVVSEASTDEHLETPRRSRAEKASGKKPRAETKRVASTNFEGNGTGFTDATGDEERIAELQKRMQRLYGSGDSRPSSRKEGQDVLRRLVTERAPSAADASVNYKKKKLSFEGDQAAEEPAVEAGASAASAATVEAATAPRAARGLTPIERRRLSMRPRSGGPGPRLVFNADDATRPAGPAAPQRAESVAFKHEHDMFKASEEHHKHNYFIQLENYQRARGNLGVLGESIGLTKGLDAGAPLAMKKARAEWVQARADLAKHSLESVATRQRGNSYERRGKGLKLEGDAYTKEVERRYQRLHVIKEAVFGAEEEEQEVRMKALRNRDRTLIDKATKALKNLPPEVGAALSAVMLSAGAVGAVATGGGALLMLPVLAAASSGAALRYQAEKAKERGDWATYDKLSKSASKRTVTGWIGMGARSVGKAVHGVFSRKQDEILDSRTSGNLGDARELGKLSGNRKEALATKQRLDARINTATTAATVAGGVLAGHALHEAFASVPVPSVADAMKNFDHAGLSYAVDHRVTMQEMQAGLGPEHAAAEAMPTAPVGSVNEMAAINHPGQGMDHLFASLRHQIRAETTDPSKLSPMNQYLLNHAPNSLSRELNAALGDRIGGTSLTMHQGDQLFLDEKDNLWFQPNGHEPLLVMHPDSSVTTASHAGIAENELHGHMQVNHPHEGGGAAPAHTEAASHEAPQATPAAPEAAHTATPAHTEGPAAAHAPTAPTNIPAAPRPVQAPTAPAQTAPASRTEAPTPAPTHTEAAPAQPPAPAPAATPEAAQAASALNAHGFDMSIPQVGLVNGVHFAHAATPELAYNAAYEYAKAHPKVPVFFVDEQTNALGISSKYVSGLMFDPSTDPVPQPINNLGSLSTALNKELPPVPSDSDYQPITAK